MELEEIWGSLQQIIQEDENQNNVRQGDIIYLKSYLPDDNKGLISGEGFATNKVECLLLQKYSSEQFASKQTDFLQQKQTDTLSNKQAEWNIFKCLFRILDSNSSTSEKEENEGEQQIQKEITELNESETNIIYGQEIQLLHLYSKCYLTLNSQALAKENCCRELRLEKDITPNSNFMLQSNTKSYGEPVLYGDILFLKSSVAHLTQWGLGIQQISPYSEVHASQIASTLRICNYVENDNENAIMNGDIIVFKNRYFGGYLSVKRQFSSTKLLQKRQIYKKDQPLEQEYINLTELKKQENLDQMFQITLERDLQLNSLWQLIGLTPSTSKQQIIKKDRNRIQKNYIIKNVLTGAFLFIENEELHFSYDRLQPKFEFQIKNLQKTEQQINLGEFYRILRILENQQAFQYQTCILQCSESNKVNVTTNCQKTQYDQQLFKVARGPYLDAMAANKIQSFYFGIVDFYIFLQDWALDKDLQYQYNVAFYNQKQLQDEINQFEKLLNNINLFLDQENLIQEIKQNQFNLCQHDILDLLIKLQQLVNQISSQDYKQDQFYNDKTAQRIARQKFDPVASIKKKKQFYLREEIYSTIYSIIFNNVDCCNYVIQEDSIIDFLFSQLNQYRDQIEKTFKQIVSKAKYNPIIAKKWLNRISTITENNLEDQIFIITIINLFISSSNQISIEGQNLCRKTLFVNNKCILLKCLLIKDQPIFEIGVDSKNFAKNNKKFWNNHRIHYQNLAENQITFEYFSEHDQDRNYHKYEQYLLNIMNLYAIMCRGRNFKNMNLIKNEVGINENFLNKIMQSRHSLQCKQVIIELFSSLYFDIDPLTKISIFENTCYLRQALDDFDKEQESGRYFYENISSNNLKQTESYQNFQQDTLKTQENMKELLHLKSFSQHIITKQTNHHYFINLFLQQEYPTILIENSNKSLNYKQIAKIQLKFFLSLIRIIKNSIDLGYNTLIKNREIQETLPNIFFILIIQQSNNNNFKAYEFSDQKSFAENLDDMKSKQLINAQFRKFHLFNQSWVSEFLLWSTSTSGEFDLIEQIFQESLSIYQVFFYLQANLQVLQYLAQKEKDSSMKELFANHTTILFNCLFGTTKFPNLNTEILQYLILSFNNQQYDLQEIKEVEILDDQIERKYFGIVNGHYEAEDNEGPKEIQQYVKKAVKYVQINQQNNEKLNEYEKSFLKLSQYIQKVNQLFEKSIKEYNQTYTKSLQNMIRNAGIHLIFVEFIMNPDQIIENENVVYFYKNVLKFWENFIRDNQTNQQILIPKLDVLCKILLIPQPQFFLDNFTYKSLSISKLEISGASNSIIDIIINISKSLKLSENLTHIRAGKQYLKILKGFTKTPTKPRFNQLSNQKQILHLILQNFKNLIDPNQYFEEKNQKDKYMQNDVLRYFKLKLHSSALNLISESCQNYYLGISETQRILLFEQLTQVLQFEPYIVKAAYLKCIFELYINLVKSNNLIGDIIDNFQLKGLFTLVIIPDLQLMQQFLKNHNLGDQILLDNKEYWKYIMYVFEFLISVIDEFRILERQNECNFIEEYGKILLLIKGILLNTSYPLLSEKRDYIQLVSEIIEEFVKHFDNFNLQYRLQIFCIRQQIALQDLINHVEQLNQKDKILKLQEICNQNNKIYVKQEDLQIYRSNKSSKQQNQESWDGFKKSFSFQHEINDSTAQVQERLKQEIKLQVLKDGFQAAKEQEVKKAFMKEEYSVLIQNPLSEDVQILFFLRELQQQSKILKKKNFKEFLLNCKSIFSQNSNYLIKLCKIVLEMKKPDKKFLDDDDQDKNKIKKKQQQQHEKNSIKQFTIFQNIISDCDIHLIAIEQLNHQNMSEQLDSLTLLHHLLDFGNSQVQQKFYALLQHHKKHKKIFIQFFKDFFNIDVSIKLEQFSSSKTNYYLNICIKVLQVLQGLCENVHIGFQTFLRIQNQQDSITNNFNFVLQTTNLLVNFLQDKSVDNSEKWELYQQGLLSLIEFSTGLNENKKEITKNSDLFSGFNEIFNSEDLDIALNPLQKNDDKQFELMYTLYIYIQLLISLLEGNANENKQVYKFLLDKLNNEFLLSLAKKIYNSRILSKKQLIYVDKYCKVQCNQKGCNKSFCINGYVTRADSLLIETGLNIYIIGLKLFNYSKDQKFQIFQFESMVIERDLIQEEKMYQNMSLKSIIKTFSISQNPQYYEKINEVQRMNNDFFDEINEEKQNTQVEENVSRQDQFFQFYREFIGRIEVVNQFGEIERIIFQKPFVCKYMTQNIKQNLIYESNRESDEDRISSLLENLNFYHAQMIHYQNVSTIPIMHFGQKHWRTLKDVSYILCVLIILFFILMPDDILDENIFEGDEQDEQKVESKNVQIVLYLNNIITVIQLILNLIIIIFCAIERYPIAVNFRRGATNVQHIQNLKMEAGFKIPEYKKKYYEFIGYLENNFEQQQVQKNPMRKIIVLLLIDFDNFYNIIIFGITAIAFFNNYVYVILLLDIVKRSEVLQNIIKAFTENTKNLLVFGFLGLIGLVLYGFLIKISFSGDFKEETKFASDSLGYSIAHVINFGLRNGGGIGDTLSDYSNPFEEPAKYWKRYFFDLTFFIIFNILFLQMIFGIIVDKFGELRDERQELLKDIQGKCFICSLERNEIDAKTKNGWFQHIYLEHNVYHMLFYLIYIKKKPITECNQLEKYIKDQMLNKSSEFIPFKMTYELQSQQKQQQ